jgi:hypothetical protein
MVGRAQFMYYCVTALNLWYIFMCRLYVQVQTPKVLWLLLFLLCSPLNAIHAFPDTRLFLGSIEGNAWQIKGLELNLRQFDGMRAQGDIRIAHLHLSFLPAPLQALQLKCAQLTLSLHGFICRQGSFATPLPLLKQVKAELNYTYQGDIRIRLDSPRFNFTWNMDAKGWQFSLRTQQVNIAELQQLSQYFGTWLTGWHFSGHASINLSMSSAGLMHSTLNGTLTDFGYRNDSDTQAGEQLKLVLDVRPGLDIEIQLQHGAIYSDPFYFNHQGHALRWQSRLRWKDGNLNLDEIHYQHPNVIHVRGALEIRGGHLTQLHLDSDNISLKGLYRAYLAHYFNDKEWPVLSLGGLAQLALRWDDKQRRVSVTLADLTLARGDVGREMIINGINGTLHWSSDNSAAESHLDWKGARFTPINLGPGNMRFSLHAAGIRLRQPLNVPILDGSLNIEQFELQKMLSDNPKLLFSGEIKPISMRAISHAFAWPELGGEISGRIPSVHYTDKHLNIDAALVLKVFDGNVSIHNLGIRDPLGGRPELHGDVVLSDLDLNLLTRFFSFGAISGRLSGKIEQLRMINWKPVAFDAFFHSADNDKTIRKISQKAINNLSSLGGAGVTQALSRSILRLFEEFNYSKLGWGCRLHEGLCEMRGIEPAATGYYIVKGGLLPPRIDVLGYNYHVDWDELFHRLQSITSIGAAVIE